MIGRGFGTINNLKFRSDLEDRTILDSVGWGSFEYAFERDLRNLTYYSRLLQLGAEPSGKAIIDESHEEDSLVVCRWHFPGRTTERKTATPFSIVSALARDEDTAEGLVAKNAALQ